MCTIKRYPNISKKEGEYLAKYILKWSGMSWKFA